MTAYIHIYLLRLDWPNNLIVLSNDEAHASVLEQSLKTSKHIQLRERFQPLLNGLAGIKRRDDYILPFLMRLLKLGQQLSVAWYALIISRELCS